MHFMNLTCRMLVNIHFQKYNRYNFGKAICTVSMGVWIPILVYSGVAWPAFNPNVSSGKLLLY